jgi:hypothetical protein
MVRRTDPNLIRAIRHTANPDRRAGNRSGQKPIDFAALCRAEAENRAHGVIKKAGAINNFDKTAGPECTRILNPEPRLLGCRKRAPGDDFDIALRRQRNPDFEASAA